MQISFTERELDVMAVLWDRGPSTVTEVRDRLAEEFAYTTVLTVLRTLEEKGFAAHREEGRAYRYHSLVERSAAGATETPPISGEATVPTTANQPVQAPQGRKNQ